MAGVGFRPRFPFLSYLAKTAGFSLHAGVAAKSHQRKFDMEICVHCGAAIKVIACIKDPAKFDQAGEKLRATPTRR